MLQHFSRRKAEGNTWHRTKGKIFLTRERTPQSLQETQETSGNNGDDYVQ